MNVRFCTVPSLSSIASVTSRPGPADHMQTNLQTVQLIAHDTCPDLCEFRVCFAIFPDPSDKRKSRTVATCIHMHIYLLLYCHSNGCNARNVNHDAKGRLACMCTLLTLWPVLAQINTHPLEIRLESLWLLWARKQQHWLAVLKLAFDVLWLIKIPAKTRSASTALNIQCAMHCKST